MSQESEIKANNETKQSMAVCFGVVHRWNSRQRAHHMPSKWDYNKTHSQFRILHLGDFCHPTPNTVKIYSELFMLYTKANHSHSCKPQLYLASSLHFFVVCVCKRGRVFVVFPPEFHSLQDRNAFEAFKLNCKTPSVEVHSVVVLSGFKAAWPTHGLELRAQWIVNLCTHTYVFIPRVVMASQF